MRACWIIGIDKPDQFGRRAFGEFNSIYEIEREFGLLIEHMAGYRSQAQSS